jgi:hypothetical protein
MGRGRDPSLPQASSFIADDARASGRGYYVVVIGLSPRCGARGRRIASEDPSNSFKTGGKSCSDVSRVG